MVLVAQKCFEKDVGDITRHRPLLTPFSSCVPGAAHIPGPRLRSREDRQVAGKVLVDPGMEPLIQLLVGERRVGDPGCGYDPGCDPLAALAKGVVSRVQELRLLPCKLLNPRAVLADKPIRVKT